MKLEIDGFGLLAITRGAKQKQQDCPRHPGRFCGDWCPLFGEPEINMECQLPEGNKCPTNECHECQYNKPMGHTLTLCGGRCLIGTIEDKRK